MQEFCIKYFLFLHFSAWKSFIGVDTDTCTYRTGAILFSTLQVGISVL